MRALDFFIIAAMLASLAVLTPHARAQSDPLTARSWQLLSGQDYLELAEYDREVYVTGVNDAYNWSFVAGFQRMKWLVPCVHGRQPEQLSAMFSKWLQENPGRWHEPAAKLFPFAMFSACRKPEKPQKTQKPGKRGKLEKPKS
jgi:hypothetical protein